MPSSTASSRAGSDASSYHWARWGRTWLVHHLAHGLLDGALLVADEVVEVEEVERVGSGHVLERELEERAAFDRLFQGSENEEGGLGPGVVAHQADPPDGGGVLPDAGADLDVVALEQPGADRRRVDAVGHAHGGELGEAVALGREQLEPELLQAVLEQPAGLVVAGPDVLEALLGDPGQARVQADDHRHRRGVVVGPAALAGGFAHVAPQQAEVEVPAAGLLHAAVEGPVVDRERREAGRDTEALLGAGVPDVDPPLVGEQLDPGDRGDRVGDQQRVALGRAERRDVGAHAGRGLGVHRGVQGGCRVGVEHPLDVDRLPPLVLDGDDLGAAAGGDVAHPLAEETVHADDHDVAVVDRVDERRLHAGAAGRADREGAGVAGAPGLAEQLARLVHDAQELGVEVPQQRPAQGVGRLGVRVGRAGAEEVPLVDHGPTLPPPLRSPRRG